MTQIILFPIKKIISLYPSTRAAALSLHVSDVQLKRLADKDSLVDGSGQVYIKSKTKLNWSIIMNSEQLKKELFKAKTAFFAEEIKKIFGTPSLAEDLSDNLTKPFNKDF